eukprot:1193948-Prorocentrum_minimum.AAC.4
MVVCTGQVRRKWRNPTQSNFVYEQKAEEVFSLSDPTPPKRPPTPEEPSVPSPETPAKPEVKPVEVVQPGRFAFCNWGISSRKKTTEEVPASSPAALGVSVQIRSEVPGEPSSGKTWMSRVSEIVSPNKALSPKTYKPVVGGNQYHSKVDMLRSSLKSEDPDEVFSL